MMLSLYISLKQSVLEEVTVLTVQVGTMRTKEGGWADFHSLTINLWLIIRAVNWRHGEIRI